MINASRGIARILKAEGTAFVSHFPSCEMNNAIGDEGGVPLIMMRDERFGVAIADAFSRVSDGKRFGVCTMQGAVNCAGLEYAMGAICQAFEDSVPILCLTDGLTANTVENSHFRADRVFAHITRWTSSIPSAARVPDFLARAYTFLKTGRPGPVLLQIPTSLGEYDETQFPYEVVKGWKSQADPEDVTAVVTALLAAKRPLLYVGEGVFRSDACAELLQFVEASQLPVITTLKAKSAFPETHPLAVGVRDVPAEHFLTECDCLFALGSSLSPNRFSHAIPGAAAKTIIQATIDHIDINKSYRTKHALIGDCKLVLRQLLAEYDKQAGGGVKPNRAATEEIKGLRAKMAATYAAALSSNDTPINPYRVYAELQRVLDPKRSLVTGDSGSARDQLSTIYESIAPHGFLGWGNISTLGFSLAAAIGGKLAFPDRQVVNVTGDAGVGYMLGNLEAPLRYNLGITTIHLNNSGYAGYGPGFWGAGDMPYTCDLTPYDKCNLAKSVEGLGLYAERVTKPTEVAPAIRRALEENAKNRPAFLEIICSQYPVWGTWAGLIRKGAARSATPQGKA
jgi:thiamine pyrophosphate-dependent acetolactate synthase large subunit-like protein